MNPIVLGNMSNIVATGDEFGNVYVYKDVESVKDNVGANFIMHSSNVQKIDFI